MKSFLFSASVSMALALGALPAHSQDKGAEHTVHHGDAKAETKADAQPAMAEGEVRRINKEQKKITLRHGELKALDMPPMTMVFNVRDAALLERVKVGDKVLFVAGKDADGSYIVTDIKPAP